jgi:tetratricopeptide (TPR) repeat protein
MFNKFSNYAKTLLLSLVEKHGKLKVIAIGIGITIALILTPIFVSTAVQNSKIQAEYDAYIAKAEKYISLELFDEAKDALESANAIKPNTDLVGSEYDSIREIKADIENSKKIFAAAKKADREGKKLKALNLYLKVSDHKYKIDEISQTKATNLKKILVKAELKKAYQQALAKRYSQAARIIRKAMKVLPSDSKLDEALAHYKQQYANQQRAKALSKMRARYDSFNDVTWYRDYSSPTYLNQNGFYIYFGSSAGSATPLHLKMQYFADDWLFIDKAAVNVDGETFLLSETSFERDNNSTIWEWLDVTIIGDASSEIVLGRDVLEKIAHSKNAVVRYTGSQYYHDQYISSNQKRAMLNVLEAYDAMN